MTITLTVPNNVLGGRKAALKWLRIAYDNNTNPSHYKKEVEISFGEATTIFVGCFPVRVGPEDTDIVYDYSKLKEHILSDSLSE